MPSLDEVFAKEFRHMMNELKANTGYIQLSDIPMPPELAPYMKREVRDMVAVGKINDQYYGKLSDSTALLWGRTQLSRRKFDYKGEYLKDKNDKYILEPVECPQECEGIVSDIPIGVPLKYKPAEKMQYVDMLTKVEDGKKIRKYVYILPRKYLYKISQTALVISWNKLRVFYSGMKVSLQTGHTLFVYIIPFKPTRDAQHNYRIIMTKPSIDYSWELETIRDYWLKKNVMFNPADCELDYQVKGETNLALSQFDGVLDEYVMFDQNKNMAYEETLEDYADDQEVEEDDF